MSLLKTPSSLSKLAESQVQRALEDLFYYALVNRGDTHQLSVLLDQTGYGRACTIISSLLNDPRKVKKVEDSYYIQSKEFGKAPDAVKALLSFRFYAAGLRWHAYDLIRNIENPDQLALPALVDVYLMHESRAISNAMLKRVEDDSQTLYDLNLARCAMEDTFKHNQRRIKGMIVSNDDSVAVEVMRKRIERYIPEIRKDSGVKIVIAMARFPGNISSIRDNALLNYLSPYQNPSAPNRLEIIHRTLASLAENPDPQSVYGHIPFMLARTHEALVCTFAEAMKKSTYMALQTLTHVKRFSDIFILPEHRSGALSFHGSNYSAVAQACSELLSYPFSKTQLSILIELARSLTPDFLPLATFSDKPVKRLMAIAPLIDLNHFDTIYKRDFRQELRKYATRIVEHHRIRPSKVVAHINSEQSASLTQLTLDSDVGRRSSNELLRTYALEQDLGL